MGGAGARLRAGVPDGSSTATDRSTATQGSSGQIPATFSPSLHPLVPPFTKALRQEERKAGRGLWGSKWRMVSTPGPIHPFPMLLAAGPTGEAAALPCAHPSWGPVAAGGRRGSLTHCAYPWSQRHTSLPTVAAVKCPFWLVCQGSSRGWHESTVPSCAPGRPRSFNSHLPGQHQVLCTESSAAHRILCHSPWTSLVPPFHIWRD